MRSEINCFQTPTAHGRVSILRSYPVFCEVFKEIADGDPLRFVEIPGSVKRVREADCDRARCRASYELVEHSRVGGGMIDFR